MKRTCVVLSCTVVILLSASIVNAQETRMVPAYRCLWVGPDGGSWINPQGDPNAVWEAYNLSWTDDNGYLINWTLMDNPSFTWPDILSMAEFKDGVTVSVDEQLPSPIQGLVIRDANLILNHDITVVGDWQDDGFMAVCVGQGADGTLIINGGTLTCGSQTGALPDQTGPIVDGDGRSRFFVGRATNAMGSAKGTVNQYGGKVQIAWHLQIGDIDYGEARELLGGYDGWANLSNEEKASVGATSADSVYNLYEGVLEVANIEIGKGRGSHGIFNVYGGKVTASGILRAYYDGEMIIDGGTVYADDGIVWPYHPGAGVMTLRKGSISFADAVICEEGIGISEVNVLGGSFDCRGDWDARGSGGTGQAQQSIKIDCGNTEWVHFGSLDTVLDAGDQMSLTLVVPKDTDPRNLTKVWIDGDFTFSDTTSVHIDVNDDFAGQVGDAWELVDVGGYVIGPEQLTIVNDSSKYTFSADIVIKCTGHKVIVVTLTDIAADE